MTDRPDGVPSDWIQVDCDNPSCPYTAWVPDLGQQSEDVPVINTCSSACALEIVQIMSLNPHG